MPELFEMTKGRLFGTYPLRGEQLANAVASAIKTGYRAFDTAQMYDNEKELGEILSTSGVSRSGLYIVTKVHPDNFAPEKFFKSVEQSLRDLKIDKADLLLLHWPPIGGDIAPSLRLLAQARAKGLASQIGVSNYTVKMMEDIASIIDSPILCNQVEFHPLLNQDKLLAASKKAGIPLCSYSAVARGEVFKHALFGEIGARHNKTAAQIVLRWIWQKGVVVNAMSTKPDNIRANWEIADFTLTNEEMARIDALGDTNYRVVTIDKVPWAPQWD